ncbi:MAG: hypothetical protein K1W14_06610 [Muribaculaceae bacterium]|jgi:hypothetical protein
MIKANSKGIILPIPSGSFYFIEWWQIRNDGLRRWLDHLNEKCWFTESMKIEFTGFCNLYLNIQDFSNAG